MAEATIEALANLATATAADRGVVRRLHSYFQERICDSLQLPEASNSERASRLGHRTLAYKFETRYSTNTPACSE
jgi:hypothetical protein